MRIIKPSFEIWDQEKGLEGIYKQIERCGRVCYASDPVEGKAKDFVDRMIKLGHGAMLEHSTVYLSIPYEESWDDDFEDDWVLNIYGNNPFTYVNGDGGTYYITTNYRVLVENDLLNDLKYLCEPIEYHEKRITVKFICDRGVSHEFVRHRVFSFAQESTRYCNYGKDKFGNELTFIIPSWLNWDEQTMHRGDFEKSGSGSVDSGIFINCLLDSESSYMYLINGGWRPQQARQVLPNAIKTELVMTGFESDWKHFFNLRCDKTAHPDARALAIPLEQRFKKNGWIE